MSSTPSTARPRVLSPSIEDLLDEVRSGRLRLPRSGRPQRWGTRQVVDLFDSIYRGFPIGNLVLAQQAGEAASLRFGWVEVEAAAQPDAWFIVDGQQRITALVGALLHPEAMPYGGPHAIWFDLEAETFHRLETGNPSAGWIPLNLCADSMDLMTWLANWPLRAERPDLVQRALGLSKALSGYAIPTYILEGADEEALRLVFERVNTTGVAMKASEVFDALAGDHEHRPLEDACVRLAELGFGTVDPAALLRVVRVVAGPLRRGDEVAIDLEAVGAAEQAVARTITFLRGDAGIPHLRLLPYRLALFVLGRLFHVYPSPSPRARQLLSRWVWRGALSGDHANASDAHIESLCRHLGDATSADFAASLLLGGTTADFEPVDPRAAWDARAAQSQLFALGLVGLAPEQLREDGATPCDWTDDLGDSWDRLSAIVRSPLCERRTPRAERLLLTAAARPLSPQAWRDVVEKVPETNVRFWSSHAMDARALDALRRGDRRAFVEARAAVLDRLLPDYYRGRAGWGQSDRPTIAHLVGRLQDATTP